MCYAFRKHKHKVKAYVWKTWGTGALRHFPFIANCYAYKPLNFIYVHWKSNKKSCRFWNSHRRKKRTFPSIFFANWMQNNSSFSNDWCGQPLNFPGGARKDPAASSSKLQQEAWLKKTGIFAFIVIIILCLFTWQDSTDACVTSTCSQTCWLESSSQPTDASPFQLHWYAQPALQFLTIIKNFISKRMCIYCDPSINGL